MATSDVIAVIALAISVLSAWISYKAYRHSVQVKEEERRLAFSRQKSEFLVRIERARKTFDALEERLKSQWAAVEKVPEQTRSALAAEVATLTADLRYLEGCHRQVWSLWHETYEMSQAGLAHHGPRFLALIESDELFASHATERSNQRQVLVDGVCRVATPGTPA